MIEKAQLGHVLPVGSTVVLLKDVCTVLRKLVGNAAPDEDLAQNVEDDSGDSLESRRGKAALWAGLEDGGSGRESIDLTEMKKRQWGNLS